MDLCYFLPIVQAGHVREILYLKLGPKEQHVKTTLEYYPNMSINLSAQCNYFLVDTSIKNVHQVSKHGMNRALLCQSIFEM